MNTSTKLSASQKGLAPILIVLILAAALVGGYLVYQKQPIPKPYRPTPTAAPEIRPSPTTNETANWETYINTNYGYSLKYPSSFFIHEYSEPISEPKSIIDTTEISSIEPSDVSSGKIALDDTNMFFMFIRYPSDKITDLSTVRENYKDTQYYNVIDYSVDNQPALKIETTSQIKGTLKHVQVMTVYKNKTFSFELRSADSKYASYFDQILSTFKFLP